MHSFQVRRVQVSLNLTKHCGACVSKWMSKCVLTQKSVSWFFSQTEREQIKFNVHIQSRSPWVARGCKALILLDRVCECRASCVSLLICAPFACAVVYSCVCVCMTVKARPTAFSRHEKELDFWCVMKNWISLIILVVFVITLLYGYLHIF